MKPIYQHLLMLCGAILVPHSIVAQTDSVGGDVSHVALGARTSSSATAAHASKHANWSEIRLLRIANPIINSPNPAAITGLRPTPISEARLTLRHDNGGYAPYYAPPKSLTLQADVESYYPLSPRVMLYGRITYDNIAARHAAASSLFNPSHMPFGIVEDSLTNTGRKHTDIYSLHGGVAANVWRSINIGAKVDFLAANYAKYKDLRHKNNVMDMTLTAGITGDIGSFLTLGGDVRYRRYTETIRFNTYGNSDKVYKSLIDYGGFMGKIEQFGEYGYTDSSREMPFLSEYYGMDGQVEWRLSPRLSTTHSVGMAYRKGYYGKRSSYTISYNQHKSHLYTWQGAVKYATPRALHVLNASLDVERLTNHSNAYRSAVDPNTGASSYEYFTPVKLSDKVWADFDVHYHLLLGVGAHSLGARTSSSAINNTPPTWELQLGYARNLLKQTAYVYPYFRRQNITSHRWYADLARNIALGSGSLRLNGAFSFGKGHGAPYTDGTLATPSDRQSPPPTMETYLYRDYFYRTAAHYTTAIAARYSLPLGTRTSSSAATIPSIYLEARFIFDKANTHSPFLDDRHRRTAMLTVGYSF